MTDTFETVDDLVRHVTKKEGKGAFFLYRGQSVKAPLLPKVARLNPEHDSTSSEQALLSELRRRGSMLIDIGINDWDLLCNAQHYGASTRLLDWTTNPLVALWMALNDLPLGGDAYIYVFDVEKRWCVENENKLSPFAMEKTVVFQPPLTNSRVAAQSGWFTVHRFNKLNKSGKKPRFVPLEEHVDYQKNIQVFSIKNAKRLSLLKDLDKLGINAQTLFPGLEGLCRYMSWRYECESDYQIL